MFSLFGPTGPTWGGLPAGGMRDYGVGRGRRGREPYAVYLAMRILYKISQLRRKPPLTLALMAGMCAIHLMPDLLGDLVGGRRSSWFTGGIDHVQRVCLYPAAMLDSYQRTGDMQLRRLLISPFIHGGDTHLMVNMGSLLVKGVALELTMGTQAFGGLLAFTFLASQLLMVVSAGVLLVVFEMPSPMQACTVGFSGVLFALTYVLSQRSGVTTIWGFEINLRYAVWVELVLVSLMVHNASLLGHLCGILAGMIYVKVPAAVQIASFLTGASLFSYRRAPSYTYSSGTATAAARPASGRDAGEGQAQHEQSSVPASFDMTSDPDAAEEAAVQEALRRSMLDSNFDGGVGGGCSENQVGAPAVGNSGMSATWSVAPSGDAAAVEISTTAPTAPPPEEPEDDVVRAGGGAGEMGRDELRRRRLQRLGGPGSAAQVAKRKNFNKEQREEVIRYLLAGSKNGVLWYGAFKEAGEKFGCYWETIKRLWMRYDTQHKAGVSSPQIENRRKGNSGRKGIPLEELKERLQDIPLNDRTTQRGLAAALGIPKSTLHRNLKALGLRAHSNALKPYLTPDGKLERLRWALRWVRSAAGGTRVFHDFEDFVHVDEKWFYLYTDGQKFYLYDDEIPPVRKVQSKRFITKVMFLAAVARPRHDPNLNAAFNGKVGMWAFTEKVPAVRNSRNRAAGTLVTKCVEVTKETYKAKLIDEVIPAIKEKWPAATRYNPIFLQQDNARPHLITNDADVLEACASDGFDIRLCNQPPNSPDTNILDLGFFASIQSLQDRCKPRTIDDLVGEVRTAWEKASPDKLGKVWTSLQACLEQTLLCGGDNTYKVPHLSKDKAARAGTPIPRRYQISEDAWIKGISSLAAGEGQGGAA
eukprot:g6690.t1